MLILEVLLTIAERSWLYLAWLTAASLVAVAINCYFLRRVVGGLMFLQMSLAFNSAIIFFGWSIGAVSLSRVGHFVGYEFLTVFGTFYIYRALVSNRDGILRSLNRTNPAAIGLALIVFNIVMAAVSFAFVLPSESSRIEFMTAPWFSYFRPFMSIVVPLSTFYPVYLLDRGKRMLPLMILASSIVSNIISGSKASFVFGIAGGYLLYRDLTNAPVRLPRMLRVGAIAMVSLAAVFALSRLDVGLSDLADRFVKFGESTIMVYYSDDPTAAASGLSTFAKVHRGIAKIFGDTSAADVDTLFGFALNQLAYGAHNFTGPNAQVASYMLCNFSGWHNAIGLASIASYLWLLHWFTNRFLHTWHQGAPIVLPFAINSLSVFVQDYYQGMSDLTLIFALTTCVLVLQHLAPSPRSLRQQHASA